MQSKEKTNSKKKCYIIASAKGGVGKTATVNHFSNLCYMKNLNYVVIDMDDQTHSASSQMKYANVNQFKLTDSNDTVDRSRFDAFFEVVEMSDFDLIFCDYGATTSDQWLHYMKGPDKDMILDAFQELDVEFHICIIVGGGGTYPACADYAEDLLELLGGRVEVTLMKNLKYNYSTDQLADLKKLARRYNTRVVDFTLVHEKGEKIQNEIQQCLKEGQPIITKGSFFTKKRYSHSLKELEENFF